MYIDTKVEQESQRDGPDLGDRHRDVRKGFKPFLARSNLLICDVPRSKHRIRKMTQLKPDPSRICPLG